MKAQVRALDERARRGAARNPIGGDLDDPHPRALWCLAPAQQSGSPAIGARSGKRDRERARAPARRLFGRAPHEPLGRGSLLLPGRDFPQPHLTVGHLNPRERNLAARVPLQGEQPLVQADLGRQAAAPYRERGERSERAPLSVSQPRHAQLVNLVGHPVGGNFERPSDDPHAESWHRRADLYLRALDRSERGARAHPQRRGDIDDRSRHRLEGAAHGLVAVLGRLLGARDPFDLRGRLELDLETGQLRRRVRRWPARGSERHADPGAGVHRAGQAEVEARAPAGFDGPPLESERERAPGPADLVYEHVAREPDGGDIPRRADRDGRSHGNTRRGRRRIDPTRAVEHRAANAHGLDGLSRERAQRRVDRHDHVGPAVPGRRVGLEARRAPRRPANGAPHGRIEARDGPRGDLADPL